MLEIKINGLPDLHLSNLVLDFNGTIAKDGLLLPEAAQAIVRLANVLDIYVITADTFGTVSDQCLGLPLKLKILESDNHTREKARFIQELGSGCIAFGNGSNDAQMLQNAALAIAIIGQEGCSRKALENCDLVVSSLGDAFALLENPQRLIATLRV